MAFVFRKLELPGLVLVEPAVHADARGFFAETYRRSEFAANGIAEEFVQDSRSHSLRGVLRGLHYQRPPKEQGKLVQVIHGAVLDAAVDIRAGSPTFGRWLGVTLSTANHRMLFVPAGFAHGFCVLSDEADVSYKATAEYAPELGAGIAWNDPGVGVQWPVERPILSDNDAHLPTLRESGSPFTWAGHQ